MVESCFLRYQVTEGVHVAVGFSMVNSILLEGPDGLVVVDTTISQKMASRIREQFRNISQKPIVAIIYTHFHPDHTYGVKVGEELWAVFNITPSPFHYQCI